MSQVLPGTKNDFQAGRSQHNTHKRVKVNIWLHAYPMLTDGINDR